MQMIVFKEHCACKWWVAMLYNNNIHSFDGKWRKTNSNTSKALKNGTKNVISTKMNRKCWNVTFAADNAFSVAVTIVPLVHTLKRKLLKKLLSSYLSVTLCSHEMLALLLGFGVCIV